MLLECTTRNSIAMEKFRNSQIQNKEIHLKKVLNWETRKCLIGKLRKEIRQLAVWN
jgi:hypothetical protein